MADNPTDQDYTPPANAQWLKQQGVQGTQAELEALQDKVAEELTMRVGNKISLLLSSEQIKEFEKQFVHAENNNEEAAIEWLEKAVPTYKDIVHDQRTKLAQEIEQAADKTDFVKSLEG